MPIAPRRRGRAASGEDEGKEGGRGMGEHYIMIGFCEVQVWLSLPNVSKALHALSSSCHPPPPPIRPFLLPIVQHIIGGSCRILVRGGKHESLGHAYCPSLVPRPSPAPVFDCLQYAKTEGEGLVNLIT